MTYQDGWGNRERERGCTELWSRVRNGSVRVCTENFSKETDHHGYLLGMGREFQR